MNERQLPQTIGAGAITEQAASWVERRMHASWSDADEAQLQNWLAQTPAHRIAFWRLEGAWNETSRLAALRPPSRHAQDQSAPGRRLPIMRALAAAAVIVAVGVAASGYFTSGGTAYSTELGERKTLTLADGSRIELNTNTVLRIGSGNETRKVWLDKGEAFFHVKHDAAHPFEVIAANQRITDLGTEFNVRTDGSRLKIAVVQGRVRFDGRDGRAHTELLPGDVAVADAGRVSLTRLATPELSERLSWRSGKLMFHHTPLSQVADEFNRYNSRKVIVAGEGARALTINGTFATNDVHAFARIAQSVLGLKVEDQGQKIVISH
jgi:transmembrane sensor